MRTISIILFCLIISGGFGQSFNDGLILYYPFNGNALDTSDNQFHGITNATFTLDRHGNQNSAMHFNGIDQYLDFPPNQQQLKPALPVSFAFWIRFDDPAPFVTQIFTTDFDQNNHTGVWVSNTDIGSLSCGYGDGTQNTSINNRRSKYCATVLDSETWYFVIAIIRSATDMSIFLDCSEESGFYEGYGGPLAYTDCQGSLGRKDAGMTFTPDYFNGAFDDFRYWNRELTSEEIDSLCLIMIDSEPMADIKDVISLFPNPASDYLGIDNLPDTVEKIEMIDSYGKLIRSFPTTENISISDINPGIYFLRFMDKNRTIIATRRFIKK